MPKEKLDLLNDVSNIFKFPQSTIDAYKVDEDEEETITHSVSLFLKKMRSHFSFKAIKRQIDDNFSNFDFVSISKYPLASSFNLTTKRIIVNMGVFGRKQIINIPPHDLYSVVLYSYVGAYHSIFPLNKSYSNIVADYLSGLYIRMFAKKYGLLGSYVDEIPKFRFLVSAYVFRSFFEMTQEEAFQKAERVAEIKMSLFDFDLEKYDFYNFRDFITVLSESGVLHGLSLYEFASIMIKSFGTLSLPMFEDGMRFLATISGSSIVSTTIFPTSLQKFHPSLYSKILDVIEKEIT